MACSKDEHHAESLGDRRHLTACRYYAWLCDG